MKIIETSTGIFFIVVILIEIAQRTQLQQKVRSKYFFHTADADSVQLQRKECCACAQV